MPSVRVRDNEPFDIAIRRFKRACEKAGTLADVHRREFYEKPTQVRKRKAAAAVKRQLKRLSKENLRHNRLYWLYRGLDHSPVLTKSHVWAKTTH